MKKVVMFSILIAALLFVGACVSDPPTPTQPPVTPPPVTPPPPSGPTTRHASGVLLNGASQYTVKRGDSLSQIAKQYYVDGAYYPLILMVNEGISDIDYIYPDTVLTIPVLQTNLNDATARASINSKLNSTAAIEEQRNRRETAAMMRDHAR